MARTKKIEEEIVWDKKKIFITFVLVVLIVFVGLKFRSYLLDQNYSKAPQKTNQQVKGVDTKELSNSIREGIQSNINNLKTQAQNLDVAEIATSSPQVQKIINDLKSLQDLPKSQLKSTCERICSGL